MKSFFVLVSLYVAFVQSDLVQVKNTYSNAKVIGPSIEPTLLGFKRGYNIIPIYEIETSQTAEKACTPFCHKELFEKPVYLLTKSPVSSQLNALYLSKGLRSFVPSDKLKIFQIIPRAVGVVFTKHDFPSEKYPYIIDSNSEIIQINQDIPYVILTDENEILDINRKNTYRKVAEMKVSSEGFIKKIVPHVYATDGKIENLIPEIIEKKEQKTGALLNKLNTVLTNSQKHQIPIAYNLPYGDVIKNLPKQLTRESYDTTLIIPLRYPNVPFHYSSKTNDFIHRYTMDSFWNSLYYSPKPLHDLSDANFPVSDNSYPLFYRHITSYLNYIPTYQNDRTNSYSQPPNQNFFSRFQNSFYQPTHSHPIGSGYPYLNSKPVPLSSNTPNPSLNGYSQYNYNYPTNTEHSTPVETYPHGSGYSSRPVVYQNAANVPQASYTSHSGASGSNPYYSNSPVHHVVRPSNVEEPGVTPVAVYQSSDSSSVQQTSTSNPATIPTVQQSGQNYYSPKPSLSTVPSFPHAHLLQNLISFTTDQSPTSVPTTKPIIENYPTSINPPLIIQEVSTDHKNEYTDKGPILPQKLGSNHQRDVIKTSTDTYEVPSTTSSEIPNVTTSKVKTDQPPHQSQVIPVQKYSEPQFTDGSNLAKLPPPYSIPAGFSSSFQP